MILIRSILPCMSRLLSMLTRVKITSIWLLFLRGKLSIPHGSTGTVTESARSIYELRQIVEQNMIAHRLTFAAFEVMVDDGHIIEELDDKYIIFPRYHNTNYSDIKFLQSHFLVKRAFVIIREKVTLLCLFLFIMRSCLLIFL